MEGKKITITNIKNYFQGNIRTILNQLNKLAPHIKEQVLFRSEHCNDCLKQGKCINCGCSIPERWYSTTSCNLERFPDLINKEDWDKYKKENNLNYEK